MVKLNYLEILYMRNSLFLQLWGNNEYISHSCKCEKRLEECIREKFPCHKIKSNKYFEKKTILNIVEI